ncbi:unnamed protein product [Sphagnum tenellum]
MNPQFTVFPWVPTAVPAPAPEGGYLIGPNCPPLFPAQEGGLTILEFRRIPAEQMKVALLSASNPWVGNLVWSTNSTPVCPPPPPQWPAPYNPYLAVHAPVPKVIKKRGRPPKVKRITSADLLFYHEPKPLLEPNQPCSSRPLDLSRTPVLSMTATTPATTTVASSMGVQENLLNLYPDLPQWRSLGEPSKSVLQ